MFLWTTFLTNFAHDTMSEILRKYLQNLGLPLNEQVEIVSHFRPLTLNSGDNFLQKGKIPNSFAFITEGIMRMYYVDENGKDITSYFLNENSFFPLAALTRQASAYSIEAISPCQLMVIKQTDFDKLFTQLPILAKTTQGRIPSLSTPDAYSHLHFHFRLGDQSQSLQPFPRLRDRKSVV